MKNFFSKNKLLIGIILAVVIVGIGVTVFALVRGKNSKEDETTIASTTSVETTEEATTDAETTAAKKSTKDTGYTLKKGEMFSYLTGKPVSTKIGNKRPLAFMINNIGDAIPQSGIGDADVIYEATVEGGITRLMAIFQNYEDTPKIGSVRSCRFYYAYWATEWDAIYCHFGQSGFAVDFLNSGKIDLLNANDDTAYITYYRDANKVAPHNVYATPDGIKKSLDIKGYDTTHDKEYKGNFNFVPYGENVTLKNDAFSASKIEMNYTIDYSYFVYDKKTKLYNRFQYGQKHIDELTGKQLNCTNVIVVKADAPLFGDGKSLDFRIVGEGKGMYFTGGKGINITWKKKSDTGITHYYGPDGKEIQLNTGKTWICVMPSDQNVTVTK